jgi:GRAM domain
MSQPGVGSRISVREGDRPRTQSDSNNGDVNIERGEILRQLFGDVGEHVEDFTCAVQSNIILHGRMYITDRFLCFYSNLFGLEKKIRIPYSHITVITKENTAFVIPNAIAITTFRKEYLFRSFWDRDVCYKLLKDSQAKYNVFFFLPLQNTYN